ncbi:MAG: hypothetical protein WCF26_17865 [Candidatus Sulfotelmatobacter sp.]
MRAVAPAKRPLGRILTQGEGEVNESEGQAESKEQAGIGAAESTLSSRAKTIVREADDRRSRGTLREVARAAKPGPPKPQSGGM